MKPFIPLLLASLTVLSIEPAMASHRHHRECFESYTRWKHGWYDRHGYYRPGRYVRDTRPVPCKRRRKHPRQRIEHHYYHHHSEAPKTIEKSSAGKTDDNSCIEGSILGGIAGGGLGAALSRGDGRLWAIPTGIVGGALVGCQVDGG